MFPAANGILMQKGVHFLRRGTSMERPGVAKLTLQNDGDLVLTYFPYTDAPRYRSDTAQSKTGGKLCEFLTFTDDGMLVLVTKDQEVVKSVFPNKGAAKMMIEGRGKIVIYKPDGSILNHCGTLTATCGHSGTLKPTGVVESPTPSTESKGQSIFVGTSVLARGTVLRSGNAYVTLEAHTGALVLFHDLVFEKRRIAFHSGNDVKAQFVGIDAWGRLAVAGTDRVTYKFIPPFDKLGSGFELKVQADGNLVMYGGKRGPVGSGTAQPQLALQSANGRDRLIAGGAVLAQGDKLSNGLGDELSYDGDGVMRLRHKMFNGKQRIAGEFKFGKDALFIGLDASGKLAGARADGTVVNSISYGSSRVNVLVLAKTGAVTAMIAPKETVETANASFGEVTGGGVQTAIGPNMLRELKSANGRGEMVYLQHYLGRGETLLLSGHGAIRFDAQKNRLVQEWIGPAGARGGSNPVCALPDTTSFIAINNNNRAIVFYDELGKEVGSLPGGGTGPTNVDPLVPRAPASGTQSIRVGAGGLLEFVPFSDKELPISHGARNPFSNRNSSANGAATLTSGFGFLLVGERLVAANGSAELAMTESGVQLRHLKGAFKDAVVFAIPVPANAPEKPFFFSLSDTTGGLAVVSQTMQILAEIVIGGGALPATALPAEVSPSEGVSTSTVSRRLLLADSGNLVLITDNGQGGSLRTNLMPTTSTVVPDGAGDLEAPGLLARGTKLARALSSFAFEEDASVVVTVNGAVTMEAPPPNDQVAASAKFLGFTFDGVLCYVDANAKVLAPVDPDLPPGFGRIAISDKGEVALLPPSVATAGPRPDKVVLGQPDVLFGLVQVSPAASAVERGKTFMAVGDKLTSPSGSASFLFKEGGVVRIESTLPDGSVSVREMVHDGAAFLQLEVKGAFAALDTNRGPVDHVFGMRVKDDNVARVQIEDDGTLAMVGGEGGKGRQIIVPRDAAGESRLVPLANELRASSPMGGLYSPDGRTQFRFSEDKRALVVSHFGAEKARIELGGNGPANLGVIHKDMKGFFVVDEFFQIKPLIFVDDKGVSTEAKAFGGEDLQEVVVLNDGRVQFLNSKGESMFETKTLKLLAELEYEEDKLVAFGSRKRKAPEQ